MREKLRRIPTLYYYLAGALFLFFFVFGATYSYLSNTHTIEKRQQIVSAAEPAFAPPRADKKDFSFLLLGHGGAGHSGGELMDSIILVSADTEAKTATMISVPRDLWIEGRKINEGYVAGGYDLLKHQIEVVTGLFPENYVSVDFDNYKRLIDTLGGLDVNVPKFYEDKYYPIRGRELDTCGKSPEEFANLHARYSGYQLEIQFECRYEDLKFETGTIHMDGETALKYVRSRHGDGDFGRSERQFVILGALKDKLVSLRSVSKISSVIDSLFGLVKTNMDLAEIKSLLSFMSEMDSYKITQIHLTDQNVLRDAKGPSGQFILLPRQDMEAVKGYVQSSSARPE